MSTFSEMAEEWMRENMPRTEPPQAAHEATEGMSIHAPEAWRLNFARWRAERCVSRICYEDSAGIGCLLLDFAEWCTAHEAESCQRAKFEALLEEAGFRCAEGMAAGLVLKVDLEAVLRFQAAPEATMPRRAPQ